MNIWKPKGRIIATRRFYKFTGKRESPAQTAGSPSAVRRSAAEAARSARTVKKKFASKAENNMVITIYALFQNAVIFRWMT